MNRIDTALNLVKAAEGWASNDDWGLATISIHTLTDLSRALEAGDSPACLRDHGDHTKPQCEKRGCARLIPAFIRQEAENHASFEALYNSPERVAARKAHYGR
jgi:hypothetical protein